MRAVLCREFGPYENLRLAEVPAPAMVPGGVPTRIAPAGVSFATSLVVAGRYQRRPPLPFVPGTEVAGLVVETAPGVRRFRPGDRVYASLDWGGQAEEAVADAGVTYALPDAVDFAAGTLLPISYPTAFAALMWRARLRAGETVLVLAAAGGVGLAAVEIARAVGARVIAAAGGADRLAVARRHGAGEGIDYRTEDLAARAKALTGGRGVDVVVDPVGGEATRAALSALARGGRLVTVGFAGGTIPDVPANVVMVKNLALLGLNYGTYMGWSPGEPAADHAARRHALHRRLAGWLAEGRLRPAVSHRFALDAFQAAMRTVLERRATGKVVLEPAGRSD